MIQSNKYNNSYVSSNRRVFMQNIEQVKKSTNQKVEDVEKIPREKPATVMPEKWDSMSMDEQILYVQLKVNESKVLHDKDSFNYWNAIKVNLENKKENNSEFSESINKLRQQIAKVNIEYKEMLSDGYIDDNELAILMERIKDLNKETLSLSSMASNQEEQMLISSIMQILSDEQKKMLSAQDISNENNHKL